MTQSRAVPAILQGGIIAGVLDIMDAFVFFWLRGVSPIRILQAIASGLLGANSFKGGFATASLGLALHFVIALGAAAVYYLASRKIRFLTTRPIVSGLLFGLFVYLFMNFLVLPLSAVARSPFSVASVLNGLFAHLFLVGLPISLSVRRYTAGSV